MFAIHVRDFTETMAVPSFERVGENAVKMIDRAKERELTSALIYSAPRDFPRHQGEYYRWYITVWL